MRHFYHEQGSDEWLRSRCGFITASNFSKLVTTQGAKSKQADTYLNAVIAEREVPIPIDTYKSAAMQEATTSKIRPALPLSCCTMSASSRLA